MSAAAPLQNLPAKSQPSGNSTHSGSLLQRKCACGSPVASLTGECAECKSKKRLQTKLAIGASNDPLEQEADRVADHVLAAAANPAVSGAPPRIQRLTGEPSAPAQMVAPASVDRILASPGRPLDPELRQDMEQRFGHDFSRVRVHSGGAAEQSAREVNASAYTVGHSVVFGAGRLAPGTRAGRRLIAHELTHVVQQSSADGISGLSLVFVQRQDKHQAARQTAGAKTTTVPEQPSGTAAAVDAGFAIELRVSLSLGASGEGSAIQGCTWTVLREPPDPLTLQERREIEETIHAAKDDVEARYPDVLRVRTPADRVEVPLRLPLNDLRNEKLREIRVMQIGAELAEAIRLSEIGPRFAAEAKASREARTAQLGRSFVTVESQTDNLSNAQLDYEENIRGWAVGPTSEVVGLANLPDNKNYTRVFAKVNEARAALATGDLTRAESLLREAVWEYNDAAREWRFFLESMQGGAATTVALLEITVVAGAVAATVASGGAATSAGYGLLGTSTATAGVAGLYGSASEAGTQKGEIIAGDRKEYEFTAILTAGAIDAATTFVGSFVGGKLSAAFRRAFADYLVSVSDEALLELGLQKGLSGPLPREYFLTWWQNWLAQFTSGAFAAPVTATVQAVLDSYVGSGQWPTEQEFMRQVVIDIITGTILQTLLGSYKGLPKPGPGRFLELRPQTRGLAVSQPRLVAEYERIVNARLPDVMRDVLAGQRSTPTRVRLTQLRAQFDQLRARVGNRQQLTTAERDTANQILREAREAARADFGNVRDAVWQRLRNPAQHPELAQIEQQLRAAGDVAGPQTGAPRVRTVNLAGDFAFEPLNLEHRVRLSDNPWLYNRPENLLASDASQNQQYLEALRQEGSIWPTDAVEDFIVRYGLNDQGIDFAPRSR
jgi:hypothetical protein